MAKGKNVLTTGDVAKICNVAPRTVSKWFDSGRLKGYRIPGSKDRRIPMNELVRFMKVHNIPSGMLPVGKIRVMIVDTRKQSAERLGEALEAKTEYEIETVTSEFETGVVAHKFKPHVLVLNLNSGDIDAADICTSIRQDEELQAIRVIALAEGLSESESAALLQKGFDGYARDASDIGELVRAIEEQTSIIY